MTAGGPAATRSHPVAVVPRLFHVRPRGLSPPCSLEATECAMLARMLGDVSITSSTRPQFRHLMASCFSGCEPLMMGSHSPQFQRCGLQYIASSLFGFQATLVGTALDSGTATQPGGATPPRHTQKLQRLFLARTTPTSRPQRSEQALGGGPGSTRRTDGRRRC